MKRKYFCAVSHMLQSATKMQDEDTKYKINMPRILIKVKTVHISTKVGTYLIRKRLQNIYFKSNPSSTRIRITICFTAYLYFTYCIPLTYLWLS